MRVTELVPESDGVLVWLAVAEEDPVASWDRLCEPVAAALGVGVPDRVRVADVVVVGVLVALAV